MTYSSHQYGFHYQCVDLLHCLMLRKQVPVFVNPLLSLYLRRPAALLQF